MRRLAKLYAQGVERMRAVADAVKTRSELEAQYRAEIAATTARTSAAEQKMASMLREMAVYRLVLASILHGRTKTSRGCPECEMEDTHVEGCEIGKAQAAMQEAAVLRAERGDSEGKG